MNNINNRKNASCTIEIFELIPKNKNIVDKISNLLLKEKFEFKEKLEYIYEKQELFNEYINKIKDKLKSNSNSNKINRLYNITDDINKDISKEKKNIKNIIKEFYTYDSAFSTAEHFVEYNTNLIKSSYFKNRKFFLIVLFDNQKNICSFIIFTKYNNTIEITLVYIFSQYQRKGLCNKLFQYIKEYANLSTNNINTIIIYQGLGKVAKWTDFFCYLKQFINDFTINISIINRISNDAIERDRERDKENDILFQDSIDKIIDSLNSNINIENNNNIKSNFKLLLDYFRNKETDPNYYNRISINESKEFTSRDLKLIREFIKNKNTNVNINKNTNVNINKNTNVNINKNTNVNSYILNDTFLSKFIQLYENGIRFEHIKIIMTKK